jgi:hypothetical protein
MNKKALKAKFLSKGVSSETFSYIPKLLTASNRTLIEFSGLESDAYTGSEGIITPKINNLSVDFIGVNNCGEKDVYINITEPKDYFSGYEPEKKPIVATIALKKEDGSIIATRAYPRVFKLYSPIVSVYSPENVAEFVKNNAGTITDEFDIVFDGEPDMTVNLKCQRMSYRTPFEPSVLMGLEREKTTARIKHRG